MCFEAAEGRTWMDGDLGLAHWPPNENPCPEPFKFFWTATSNFCVDILNLVFRLLSKEANFHSWFVCCILQRFYKTNAESRQNRLDSHHCRRFHTPQYTEVQQKHPVSIKQLGNSEVSSMHFDKLLISLKENCMTSLNKNKPHFP